MSISISGSNLQQSIPHIHREHASASKGLDDESSASQTDADATDTDTTNTTGVDSMSSMLTSFLSQLSSLDRERGNDDASDTTSASASGTNADSAASSASSAASSLDTLRQDLQNFLASAAGGANPDAALPATASPPADQLMRTLQAFAAKPGSS